MYPEKMQFQYSFCILLQFMDRGNYETYQMQWEGTAILM